MPKLPTLKPKEVEKILHNQGFYLKRQSGSHRTYYSSSNDAIVVVPFHSSDLPKGTLKSIIRQSKLSLEMFIKRK